jgi:hypothetical protein
VRKLFLSFALLLALMLLAAGRADANISIVQTASAFGSTANQSAAYSSNVTNGNLLLMGSTVWNGPASDPTVLDTLLNSWTKIDGIGMSGGSVNRVVWYYTFTTSGGADTVTCTSNTHSGMTMGIAEMSGVSNSGTINSSIHDITGSCTYTGAITISSNRYSISWGGSGNDLCGSMMAALKGSGSDYLIISWMGDISANHSWNVSTNSTLQLSIANTTVGQTSGFATMPSVGAPIANYVQSNFKSGGGTSLASAFVSNNTAGNAIVACFGFVNTTTDTVSLADSHLQTYTQFKRTAFGSSSLTCFYSKNSAAGANTITATSTGSGTLLGVITEYSGLSTSSPLDVANGSGGNSTSCSGHPNCAAGSITTTNASDVLFFFVFDGDNGGSNFQLGGTPASGWALREEGSSNSRASLGYFNNLSGSTGTYSMTGSINPQTSNDFHLHIGAFGPGGGRSGFPTVAKIRVTQDN